MSLSQKLRNIFNSVVAETGVHRYYLRKHLAELGRRLEPDSSILDAGSGETPYRSIFGRCQSYISLDFKAGKDVNIIGDVCDLPIRDGAMDVIICTEVLEHIEDTRKAMSELNRALKKDGHLILTTPLLIGIHEPLDFFRFTELALRSLLPKYGFEILEIRKRGGIFSSLGAMLTQVPYQVLGPYDQGMAVFRPLKGVLAFIAHMCLVPLTRLFIVMDGLDKEKNFTCGYSVMCVKRKNCPD